MRKLICCLIAALLLALCAGTALAEIQTVTMSGTYGQTEARSMLDMVNAFRASEDAWYWNEDNASKTECADLAPLAYDYNLERAAMQRAIEIALSFSHTRPNSASCFSAISGAYWSMGENIAIGQRSAESAYVSWREDDDGYSGQGHRRNMLGSDYNCIGIGHVVVNGVDCWVQEFGYTSDTYPETAAVDGEQQMHVPIDLAQVKSIGISYADAERLHFTYGEAVALPAPRVKLIGTWDYLGACKVALQEPWSVTDTAVAGIEGTDLRGLKAGTTTLSTTLLGLTMEAPVTVDPIDLSTAQLNLNGSGFTYTGEAHTPQVSVSLNGGALVAGEDYGLSYTGNLDAGTATVTVTGINNYTGSAVTTFAIAPADIAGAAMTSLQDSVYSGAEQKPAVSLSYNGRALAEGSDYTLSYSGNLNAGVATVTASGTGNYTGSAKVSFNIAPASLESCALAQIGAQTYTGASVEPALDLRYGSLSLTAGRDYTASYSDNLNAGTATVAIEGTGNYQGKATAGFTITPASVAACTVSAIKAQTYTGEAIEPAVALQHGGLKLTAGRDYTASYSDNLNAGTATVAIEGMGNYQGKATVGFEIAPVSLNDCAVSAIKAQTYTGAAIKPAVALQHGELKLTAGQDYTLAYENNRNAGNATVVISGTGNYAGTAKVGFTIKPVSLKKCAVTGISNKTCNGKELKQSKLTVKFGGTKLKAGQDYKVTYKNNRKPGKATVVIAGTGNFSGKVKATFAIKPKATGIKKLKPGKKQITVKWKALSDVTGYEIEYSLKSSFAGSKTVRVKGAKKSGITIKSLKAKKKYYVRIRAYKLVDKKTYYYSAWSKVKTAKPTKK